MDLPGIHTVGTSMYISSPLYIRIYSFQLSKINLFRYLFMFVKDLFLKLYYFKNNTYAKKILANNNHFNFNCLSR